MKNKIFALFILSLFFVNPVFAEKIPIRIAPVKTVTTYKDATEVGDIFPFEVINNVYVDDKLYLAKYSRIYGLVDFVHPNGWGGDAAEVRFKTFFFRDSAGKKISIDYPIKITGKRKISNDIKQYFAYAIAIIRGAEVCIEPDTAEYTIFMTR